MNRFVKAALVGAVGVGLLFAAASPSQAAPAPVVHTAVVKAAPGHVIATVVAAVKAAAISNTNSPVGEVYGCAVINKAFSSTIPLLDMHGPYNGAQNCGAGHQKYVFYAGGSAGPKGATGATGAPGKDGKDGASAITTVTGSTNITNWPETSGWANDNFTRALSVTDNGAVDNSNCSGAPDCYFFTFNLTDGGHFTTVDGADSPNGSSADKIAGTFEGDFQGVAKGSFYADSNKLSQATIPVSADGGSKPATTTTWGKLALPNGTSQFDVHLSAYSWTYSVVIQEGVGCAKTTTETWVDAINPGSDGQNAGDGNITGNNGC
jgi:hypothetical protein